LNSTIESPSVPLPETAAHSRRWSVLWQRLWLPSLERRMFLVAAASLLPLALLCSAILVLAAREHKERLLTANQQTMQALISAVDSELESAAAALDALAASPRLAQGDFRALHQEARELLQRRATWLNVVVSRASSEQVLNAHLPFDVPLPADPHPMSVREAAEQARPVVSNLIFSKVLNAHAFAVHVPFRRGDEVEYVLSAVIRPESLAKIVHRQRVSELDVISIVDRNHRVVMRSGDHEQWIGRSATGALLTMLQSGRVSGWIPSLTLEGRPVYTTFHVSAFSGWAAISGMPRKVIDGPVLWSYLAIGGSIIISVLLGLIAAAVVGATIVRPMRELEQSALRVGHGDAPVVPATSLQEVRRIGSALIEAHAERERALLREREARVAAESASRSKDEFLAMLGHELRNPLAAIATATYLLERHSGELKPSLANAAAIIGRQTRHLGRLTNDLLDAGRIILGKITLSRIRMDLAAAVQSSLDALRNTGQLAHHRVTVTLEPAWIDADPTRIDQITLNLLTNAIKYTPAGGAITVRVNEQHGQALLHVSDTGLGLESDLLPRVFELFVQGERSIDRAQGGLGIGLTLVRRLAELHGGSATAASAGTDKGATFTVSFPAVRAPDPILGRGVHSLSTRVLRIALIEDNDDVRSGVRGLLELDGHQVVEAADGPSGIALLRSDADIDIALVDIGLPGMDGFEVARTLRATDQRDLRLIAMTGYGGQQERARGMAAGFNDYLIKPVEPQELKKVLQQVLER
jgi:signal transduction histidine kinase